MFGSVIQFRLSHSESEFTQAKERRVVCERFPWSQDKTPPVEEESVSAEILAPAPKEPTEAPAPTPAETGISLSTSQGRSLTFPRNN